MLHRAQTEHANVGTTGTCTWRHTRGTVGFTNIIHPARRRVDPPFAGWCGCNCASSACTRPRNHRARQHRRSKHPRPASSLRGRAITFAIAAAHMCARPTNSASASALLQTLRRAEHIIPRVKVACTPGN